jgi:hypothetical protein
MNVEGKVKVIQPIKKEKKKDDVCREFGLVTSVIQTK